MVECGLRGELGIPNLRSADRITRGVIMEALKLEDRYTYSDYCKWDDSERLELIDGVPYAMSPAPSWRHQDVSVGFIYQLRSFLAGKPCKVFAAPFDVRLNADAGDDTVVQPDIVVICDRSKITGTGCVGAPDMAIEILSPSTESRDTLVKFKLYMNAGVREYWIVDPDKKTVAAHVLDSGRFYVSHYSETDTAPVHVLEGCDINLSEVFMDV